MNLLSIYEKLCQLPPPLTFSVTKISREVIAYQVTLITPINPPDTKPIHLRNPRHLWPSIGDSDQN